MRYSYLQATDGNGRLVTPSAKTDLVFLVNVFEGEADEPFTRGLLERIWRNHQNEFGGRPLSKTIRSMCVGDVIVLHDGPSEDGLDERSMVLVANTFGFRRVEDPVFAKLARSLAGRGVPGHVTVPGSAYYSTFEAEEEINA